VKNNLLNLAFRFDQAEGIVLPEPFYLRRRKRYPGAEPKLYWHFGIAEGNTIECIYMLL